MTQSLPGFRDFLPADCAVRNYIFVHWPEVARRSGFVEWAGSVLEPAALCIDIVRAFGLADKDFVVRISDREFWTDLLRSKEIPENRWEEVLQTIDKFGREPRDKSIEKLGPLADPVLKVLNDGGKSARLEKLVEGLRERGLAGYVDVDVRVVRGLAYYTGVVFEIFDRAGKFRAIAGGGRYDNLVGQLSDGATSMPALG